MHEKAVGPLQFPRTPTANFPPTDGNKITGCLIPPQNRQCRPRCAVRTTFVAILAGTQAPICFNPGTYPRYKPSFAR